jgi:hypothetical protein
LAIIDAGDSDILAQWKLIQIFKLILSNFSKINHLDCFWISSLIDESLEGLDLF